MKNQSLFDPELAIQSARTGDADAVASLIEHYRPYLRLLAQVSIGRKLRTKVADSDVVQEASLQAARDLPSFLGESEAELTAWLRSVLSNVIANSRRHFERGKRNFHLERQLTTAMDQSSVSLETLAAVESSPSHRAVRREQAVILAETLEKLPDEYRLVITRRELEGCSLSEIAEELGKSRNAIQKLWARGISEMRRMLKDVL